jgi:hypothetical protein
LTLPFPEAGDRAPASSGGAQARTIEESWRSRLGVELECAARDEEGRKNSGAFANASPAHDRFDLHKTSDEQGRSD